MSETPSESKKFFSKNNLIKAAGLIVVVLAVMGGYFFLQYERAQNLLNNQSAANQKQAQDVINRVSRLLDLPKNEKPTVATVTDKEKLMTQAFFAKAENGDKVLIYPNAREAVLYRPSIDKVVNLTTELKLGQDTSPTPGQVAGATSVKVTPSAIPAAPVQKAAPQPTTEPTQALPTPSF